MTKPLFLLDTNILIYILEGLSDLASERIQLHEPGEVVTSAIAYAEVIRGIDPADAAAGQALDDFFEAVPVLPFDFEAAQTYPRVPFRRAGFDRLIAAHALALGLTLVTNNERDFSGIPGLRVENWTQP